MQPLSGTWEREINDHRRAASKGSTGSAFEIIGGICAHERHLKVRVGINAARHHITVRCIQLFVAGQVFANLDDLAILDQNVSFVRQIMGDDSSVFNDSGHGGLPAYFDCSALRPL